MTATRSLSLLGAALLRSTSLIKFSGSLRELQPGACFSIYRGLASEPEARSGSWIPGWVKAKIPRALGGEKDTVEDLTLDAFASSLKHARRLGGITGFVHGTGSISDPTAQGTMRLFESVIAAMKPQEKVDLALFNAPARQRVATDVGCTTSQVDDCIARFLWMRSMTAKLAELKKQGKPMPSSMTDVEAMLGSWRQYKTEMGTSGSALAGGEGGLAHNIVPMGTQNSKGQACPMAGIQVSRNTKCPLTRKAFKNCCGKK